jgi:hypothetical protein
MARIRNLSTAEAAPQTTSRFWLLLKAIFVGIVLSSVYLIVNDNGLLNDFKRISLTQYQIYVYGKSDYCNRDFDPEIILQTLRKDVHGQLTVLNEIDESFRAHTNVTSLALIGTQGTGKTLTIETIQRTFPWQYNIQYMLWSNLASEQGHLRQLKEFLSHLTACGQNGIFVDNIPYDDVHYIAEFNNEMHEYCIQNEMDVMAFYVFGTGKLNVNEKKDVQLEHSKSINYREFNEDDLRDCITREAKHLNVEMNDRQIEYLMDNIDVKSTGCKTVAAKVSRHVLVNL